MGENHTFLPKLYEFLGCLQCTSNNQELKRQSVLSIQKSIDIR
jgi:hypothetical protein